MSIADRNVENYWAVKLPMHATVQRLTTGATGRVIGLPFTDNGRTFIMVRWDRDNIARPVQCKTIAVLRNA